MIVEAVPLDEAQVSQMMKVQKEERAAVAREAAQTVPVRPAERRIKRISNPVSSEENAYQRPKVEKVTDKI